VDPGVRLFIDHNIFSAQAYGGVFRYFSEIISRLQNSAIDVTTFTPFFRNEYLAKIPHSGLGPIRADPFGKSGRIVAMINEELTRRHLRHKHYDVVHETNLSGRSYLESSAPVLHTVHDLTPELFPDQFFKYDSVLARRRQAFSSTGRFIAISENTKQDLMRVYGVGEDRIRVIHHGHSRLPSLPLVNRRSDLVLYVGSRRGYKNFEALVEALETDQHLARNIELLMFGGGDIQASERTRLRNAGIRRFHHVQGDDRLLVKAYGEATLFVYPSLYEGFGLPLLEAMDADCPIMCSNASCFPEVAGDAAQYFDPTIPEEIAQCLGQLIADASLRNRLVQNGRTRIGRFSWDASAAAHADYYRTVAEEG